MTTEIKIGDIIKSLDFAGNELNYMIGEVYWVEHGMIHCETKKVFRDGLQSYEALVINRTFRTPVQGDHFLDEKFPGRLTVVS